MKKIFLVLATVFLAGCLEGCMSKNEYALRYEQLKAAEKHPKTFPVLKVKGPLNLGDGAEMIVEAPTQPYKEQTIPDGGQQQLNALNTAAIAGGAIYGASKIKGNTKNTTINNNGGTP